MHHPSEQPRGSLHRWSSLLAGLGLAGLVVAPLRSTEPPCAYVLRRADPTPVVMPAIPLVHLDEPGHGRALSPRTCTREGESTPALVVPVHASLFESPETLMEVGSIVLDFGAHPVTRPGHVLTLEGGDLLVLPSPGDATPTTSWDMPEPSITFRLGGIPTTARYLPPTRDLAVESTAKRVP
ncbi:hypothetical protein [Archangium lipolyticum]|uniref:hypothetical protein n=1 Tax=Archangium lipolyticum TaxID=2970465 RepID=UPI00214A344A|nr:hypothetical protein [Archangium lipolyticum]